LKGDPGNRVMEPAIVVTVTARPVRLDVSQEDQRVLGH